MANTPSAELNLARLRRLVRRKPRTKAGQVRQAWPEIRELLASGHALKDVCTWLNEIGIDIGYARLSDYVNQLRRADHARSLHAVQPLPPLSQGVSPQPSDDSPTEPTFADSDPLANVRLSEAKQRGFQYRAAEAADEKDLI